jgi:hypothetical protein
MLINYWIDSLLPSMLFLYYDIHIKNGISELRFLLNLKIVVILR